MCVCKKKSEAFVLPPDLLTLTSFLNKQEKKNMRSKTANKVTKALKIQYFHIFQHLRLPKLKYS